MSLLASAFREAAKKTKDYAQYNEMTYSVSYPTGFFNLDCINGYIQKINGNLRYELGLSDGSINVIISDSGLGKTTLATQIACNIVRPFPNSVIFYEQAEVGTNIQRIKVLSGFRTDEEFVNRFVIRDADITIESIYERVKMIHDIKIENKDSYLYDTGMDDMSGNRIFKFEPTVVIVDSIKMVMSKKNSEADETNNMTGATNAKANSEYYTKMAPLCRGANIIMILINHITTDVNTGFFPKKPEFAYLKQGEHLPGSKMIGYICNCMFRLDLKSKLKSEEGFGIDGSVVSMDIVKSRTNKSARGRCNLVFDQNIGFDPILSLFVTLDEAKLFEGAGVGMRVPGCEIKFSKKNFKTKYFDNPELKQAFDKLCIDYFTNMMMEEYNETERQATAMINGRGSLYDNIINSINQ